MMSELWTQEQDCKPPMEKKLKENKAAFLFPQEQFETGVLH